MGKVNEIVTGSQKWEDTDNNFVTGIEHVATVSNTQQHSNVIAAETETYGNDWKYTWKTTLLKVFVYFYY